MVQARNGRQLARYPGMDAVAQGWADQMAQKDTLSHRTWLAPYSGEVIASGAWTADAALSFWMSIPEDRATILDTDHDKVGIGYNSGYWIAVFS
jgi:uncharacterized protein YkwD